VLQGTGLEVALAPTTRPGEATDLARAAAASGVDLVLACGGDGTLNEAINGLAPSRIPLGILPGGTANILARELCLPQSPVAAARQFRNWSPRRIALGRARWAQEPHLSGSGNLPASQPCRYFASVAGIGFDAHIVYKLSPQLKMGLGVAGYVVEAFRQLLRYTFPKFTWRVNGEEGQATFAVVHRTRLYAGWLHLAPSAGLDQPHLVVCSFASPGRARYLLYALAVLTRQHLRLGDVRLAPGTEVCCLPPDNKTPVRFELDGELAGALPATFEIVPDALTLLAP